MYEVKLSQFSGPLDALLELIEVRKLEITQISLAEVTVDFLNYIKTLSKIEPNILADFLQIAAQLLVIKSKALLPSIELAPEEEQSAYDLERRLKFHQEFRGAVRKLHTLWDGKGAEFSRPLFLGKPAVFYPPDNFTVDTLVASLRSVIEELKVLMPRETETVRATLVTIEEKIEELIQRITGGESFQFSGLSKNKPKSEVIVLFLAILHLLKNQLINIEQGGVFSDILIRK